MLQLKGRDRMRERERVSEREGEREREREKRLKGKNERRGVTFLMLGDDKINAACFEAKRRSDID